MNRSGSKAIMDFANSGVSDTSNYKGIAPRHRNPEVFWAERVIAISVCPLCRGSGISFRPMIPCHQLGISVFR